MQYTAEWETEPQLKTITDAAQDGPVFIQHDDRPVGVLLSPQQYELLRQSAIDEFERICDDASDEAEAKGLTEEILQELLRDE